MSKQRPHLVPLPAVYRSQGSERFLAGIAHERVRRESGYTSVRVSKATAALLRELESVSHPGHRGRPGLDAMLYYDALERLGRLPDAMLKDRAKTLAVSA